MEYICVFKYISTLHLFPKIYSNLPLYKMKWNNLFCNLLPRLYSNIICKNIVRIFQKFEVGYTQTCTSLQSSTLSHPKGGHRRYKKDSDLDVHVWIFKAIIQTNDETIDEVITNCFNFMLRNNASYWCNNYICEIIQIVNL